MTNRITCLFLSFVVATSFLAGCKSADRILFQTPSSRLASPLPPLELVMDNGALALTEGALPQDPMRVFQQEMDRNIVEPVDSTRFGYARLLVTKAEVKRTGHFFQAVQMITLMVPSLLGLPMEYYRTEVRAQVQITNALGDTLGTYTGSGRSKVRVAMYYGYSQSKAPRLSDMQALRLALDDIRPQLASSADTLRQQLLATGPLKPEGVEQAAKEAEETAVPEATSEPEVEANASGQ